MERINELFRINIENSLVYSLDKLNSLVYKMEWLLIVLGFFIAVVLVVQNRKKYSYRYELSRWLKISLFMMATAYLIKILNIKTIIPVFDVVFYELMPITFLCIIIGYTFDKIIFYKCNDNLKTEIRYLEYAIIVTYTFLLISCMYGIENIILPSIGQVILISVKFWIENKENHSKNKNCILYETRKKQLNILKDIIKSSDYENYAIALDGEWGSGKSKLIAALINDCSKENYYYIYIKPMVSDTQESLIREFQKGISKLMKHNGIYSGRNSSLDKYFKEILKLIQFNNKVTLADFIDFTSNDSSYKDLKEELQDDIDLLLGKGSKKLIVVIDDFDRVDEDKQVEILSFIKEIIDFMGCITIIALDYENLKNNDIVNPTYLEKFIGTQLPLVCMEFNEIITFHAKDILNESSLENEFSKKILQELSENIYDYYNNIDKRISDFYKKQEENINKSKENREKDKKDLNEYLDFAIERSKYIDNSRRVVHFLKEIQNTIVLIDKLYKDREVGQELLKTVKVSEIVYLFNYIKVFYKEAYESIVKLKGIDEYCAELYRKDRKLEEKYFKVILGDIIPENISIYEVLNDESKELNRINSLNLIKDLFINYYFTKNNVELLTNSELCLNQVDNNCISINENFLESVQAYQNAIFKHSKSKEQIIERIKSLVKYAITLYEQKKIDFPSILEISTYRNNYRDMVYVKYYLEEICKLVDEGKVNKVYKEDKIRIESILRDLEMNNISQYRYIFVELLVIATLDKNNDGDIDKLFEDLMENDKLLEKLKKYSIDNNLIKEKDNITDLSELLTLLFRKVKTTKFTVIDLELLNKRLEEFLLNYQYINKLKRIKINVDCVDRYKELFQYFNIEDTNEAKEILKDLAQEEIIDSNMMGCFQKLIKIVIRENAVDDECRSNTMTIFKKLKEEYCWHEYGWFNIMVNVERVLNSSKDIG